MAALSRRSILPWYYLVVDILYTALHQHQAPGTSTPSLILVALKRETLEFGKIITTMYHMYDLETAERYSACTRAREKGIAFDTHTR